MKNHIFNKSPIPGGIRTSTQRKMPIQGRGINTDWETKPQTKSRGTRKYNQYVIESIDDAILKMYCQRDLKPITVSCIRTCPHTGKVYGVIGKRKVRPLVIKGNKVPDFWEAVA